MDSYIQSPEVHAQARANPIVLGGPFLDLVGKLAADVGALKHRAIGNQKDLIEFSAADKKLGKLPRSKATGYSLQALYAEVQDILH